MFLKQVGYKGELIARTFIVDSIKGKNKTFKLMQLDWLIELDNRIIVFEIKTQEQYDSPDGHGLPPYQIKSRLSLLKAFNKEALFLFVVICLTDSCIYTLEIKDNWEKIGFYTKTKTRFIFPLELFKKHSTTNLEIDKLIDFYKTRKL